MKLAVVIISAIVLLAGCASREGTRVSEPVAHDYFPGQWREFAECVNFQIGDRVLYDAAEEKALVGKPSSPISAGVDGIYELTIRQADPSNVEVELRHMATLNPQSFLDHYWSAVERCGADQTFASFR